MIFGASRVGVKGPIDHNRALISLKCRQIDDFLMQTGNLGALLDWSPSIPVWNRTLELEPGFQNPEIRSQRTDLCP